MKSNSARSRYLNINQLQGVTNSIVGGLFGDTRQSSDRVWAEFSGQGAASFLDFGDGDVGGLGFDERAGVVGLCTTVYSTFLAMAPYAYLTRTTCRPLHLI